MPHNRGEKSKILRGSFILANPIFIRNFVNVFSMKEKKGINVEFRLIFYLFGLYTYLIIAILYKNVLKLIKMSSHSIKYAYFP